MTCKELTEQMDKYDLADVEVFLDDMTEDTIGLYDPRDIQANMEEITGIIMTALDTTNIIDPEELKALDPWVLQAFIRLIRHMIDD